MKLPKWAVALDVLAIAAVLLTISVVVFGGFRISVPGSRLSMMDWTRPGWLAAIALTVRHAAVRHRPLPQHVVSSILAWWRRPDTRLLLPIHVATRGGVLMVGFLAVILIGYPPEAQSSRWSLYPDNAFLDLPARWDTGWYLGVATEGYQYNAEARKDYQQNIAFFPAFPMLMRFLSPVLGRQPVWTGVGISLVSFFLALGYLLHLARMELGDDDAALTAVALLATYPFAVFYSVAYTEALFLLTIVGAVYHFRRDQLVRSAAWGVVAGLTRPNGCFLSIVLGLMAIAPLIGHPSSVVGHTPVVGRPSVEGHPSVVGHPFRGAGGPIDWSRLAARLAAAAAPGVGMLLFSAYIYALTGNAFQWTAQNAAWGREYRSLDHLVIDRLGFIATNGLYAYASTQTIDFFYLLAVLFVLATVWPVYKRFGVPYAAMLLVNVLPPLAAGGLLSMGRVTSVLFPAFLWLGGALPVRHRTAWIAFFACLQGFVAAMFFTWRPLY